MSDLFAIEYPPAAWIAVSGVDAFPFLQGQFSNNIDGRGRGSATYGLWLNAKGGIDGDSLVLREEDERFILHSENTPAAVLGERLESFIFADDVTLDDRTDSVAGAVIWGMGARDLFGELCWEAPAIHSYTQPDPGVWVFPAWWSRGEAFEVVVALDRWEKIRGMLDEKLSVAGGVWTDESSYRFACISSGLPAPMLDLAAGALPQVGGLENLAVSYDKGCYTGQEVMARLRNKGRVRRVLLRVNLETKAPVGRCSVYFQNQEVGSITSVGAQGTKRIGFVSLERKLAEQIDRLSLEPNGEPCIQIFKPHSTGDNGF